MIEFVNLEDGRIFNGDKPYVFWFENGQSVNLNYVLKICFISNYRLVNVHLESEVFALLDLTQQIPALNNPDTGIAEVINARTYIDLDRL
jgi:hypothetical protein